MKNKLKLFTGIFYMLVSFLLCSCGQSSAKDKDFSELTTPGSQEEAYEYRTFFLPAKDGPIQPYVGDTMPYYEDGVYYIYYLKEGGDSYNHSIYLATTKDFVTYTEQDEVVLKASDTGQDAWIGTGSVVKAGGKYYFFYTGHADSADMEYKEKIMVAESDNLTAFHKIADWEITPPDALGKKMISGTRRPIMNRIQTRYP